jgi:N-methylhydantoinase A
LTAKKTKTDGVHRSIRLGIDVGGTFTDVIAMDEENGIVYTQFKIPSTPDDPAQAINQAIAQVQIQLVKNQQYKLAIRSLHHGTTVGTNALIEKRGARTALLTTEKFRDVLELRRQIRPELYNLFQKISPPLVPKRWRIGVRERMDFNGNILTPLDHAQLNEAIGWLKTQSIESIAICTLHSYVNPQHEQLIKAEIEKKLPSVYVTCSNEVCPEYREYERTSTTVVNAYIGPAVSRYIERIENNLKNADIDAFRIVKSNGGLTSSENGRKFPVNFIESGPAAGVMAILHLCKQIGIKNAIAFDMGGTTAKVGVIKNGQQKVTTEFYADQMVEGQMIGGYPIKSPVIDIVEIGAGGGSIARLDKANVLKVGPDSAGADPGPACYGRGGMEPTITDAYAALGFLDSEAFNSGRTPLFPKISREVINARIAQPLGWTIEKACYAILDIATANMSEMVRLATVRRGLDPKDFVLFAYGGAGPLHAGKIAQDVGIPSVIIPPLPGLLSAFGTLVSNIRHDLVQTFLSDLKDVGVKQLQHGYENLEKRARDLLEKEKVPNTNVNFNKFMDLRFKGQIFEFPILIHDIPNNQSEIDELEAKFRVGFKEEYGYDLHESKIEVVNLRMEVNSNLVQPDLPIPLRNERRESKTQVRYVFGPDGSMRKIPTYFRSDLPVAKIIEGPAIVEDEGSTIRIEENQNFTLDSNGFFRLELREESHEHNTFISDRSSRIRSHSK